MFTFFDEFVKEFPHLLLDAARVFRPNGVAR
jgi:hypothetical protein